MAYIRNQDSIKVCGKLKNRRLYLFKNKNGDNAILFKMLHTGKKEIMDFVSKNPNYYSKVIEREKCAITEIVIVLSNDAIELLFEMYNFFHKQNQ
jgi:hypothetical protein